MADYTIMVIGEALSHAVQRAAPRARLHIRLVRESLAAEYSDGIRFVDGMVAPPSNGFALPDTRSAELFRDRWVCVLDGDNPVLDGGSALRIRDLAGLPWVAPYYRSGHARGRLRAGDAAARPARPAAEDRGPGGELPRGAVLRHRAPTGSR